MNKTVSEIELSESIFGLKIFPDLLHQYIRYQNAKNRQGSHKTKTRSEIKGKYTIDSAELIFDRNLLEISSSSHEKFLHILIGNFIIFS